MRLLGLFAVVFSSSVAMATFGTITTYETRVISETRSGPPNYHETYANIESTVVTLHDIRLRTNAGTAIPIPSPVMRVDLQDLMKFGRGLLIDTRGVPFPGGADEIDVVEIEMRVSKDQAVFTSSDGSSCGLNMPKFLNFYTTPDTPTGFRVGKDEYLVKIDFSPLNAIQIDQIVQTTQQYECCSRRHRSSRSCKAVGPLITSRFVRCEMANRRHPIARIIRKVDEF